MGYWSGRKDTILEQHGIQLGSSESANVPYKSGLHNMKYLEERVQTVSEEDIITNNMKRVSIFANEEDHGIQDDLDDNEPIAENDEEPIIQIQDEEVKQLIVKQQIKQEKLKQLKEQQSITFQDNQEETKIEEIKDEKPQIEKEEEKNDLKNIINDGEETVEEVKKPRKTYPPLPEGEKLKVYIVSHRRSGTHLTITTITNNFENVEVEKQEDHPACDESSMGCERLEKLLETGKVVHAYRDVRDVLVSVYFYQEHIRKKNGKPPSNQTFSDFLTQKNWHPSTYRAMNRVEYWRHHYESWMAVPGLIHLNFEDTVSKPEETLLRLEEYLQIPLKGDRKPMEEWDKGHTVFFRKGQAGDWVNHFSEQDRIWVDNELSKPFDFTPMECPFLNKNNNNNK